MDPSDTPTFVRFFSHWVRLAQSLPESPPKLNPTNGTMNPSALAGTAVTVRMIAADARYRNRPTGVSFD
jgi:hypothetical protein